MRSIFLDRDGVINENLSNHVKNWEEFTFIPRSLMALRWLRLAGFRVFIVTNQAIVSRGLASEAIINDIHTLMRKQIEIHGGYITAIRYCPHDSHEQCACRKPQPGMLLDLAQTWQVDLTQTYIIGDSLTDIMAGHTAGCQSILVRTGRGKEQIDSPNIQIHQPKHIAADLFDAVRWLLHQEGYGETNSEFDTCAHKPIYTTQPVSISVGS